MKSVRAILLCAAVMVATAAPATTYLFTSTLKGANEIPPNASLATGQILVQLDDVSNILSVSETFSGLTNGATGAHIHCCVGLTGNAAIAVGFLGFPVTTSGTYNMTFDLTNVSIYTIAFVTASGGTATGARNALIAGLLGGQAYANIHNAAFPSGEIRGQLAAVPEPASWAMMAMGFGLTGAALRRRVRVRIATA